MIEMSARTFMGSGYPWDGCYSRGVARIEAHALPDPEQVYLAASLGEARKVEALLTSRDVMYATQVEVLGRSTLFGSLRHGAAFYVSAGHAESCRGALAQAGFERGIVPTPTDL